MQKNQSMQNKTHMKKTKLMYLIIALLAMISTNPVLARGGHVGGNLNVGDSHRHFRGGGGHHHHNDISFGFNFGGGYYDQGFFGPAYYGFGPYGYRDPFFYPRYNAYPPTVVAPPAPTVYIQQEKPQTHYWHYCRNPEGYYPYIKKCPEGWLQVAPQPAQ
jgi:hypothetical protein